MDHKVLCEMLEVAGVPAAKRIAQILIDTCQPRIEELTLPDETIRKFIVENHPLSNLLACFISGDRNIHLHSGPNATEQTLVRIGSFAGVISLLHPGAILYSINHIKFLRAVELPNRTLITAEEIIKGSHNSLRKRIRKYCMKSFDEGTQIQLSEEAIITTALLHRVK